jgi:hypothetical protein
LRGEKLLELGHEFWQHVREEGFHGNVSFQWEREPDDVKGQVLTRTCADAIHSTMKPFLQSRIESPQNH